MMGNEDRRRILQMVSEGKLSPEEAADLLEAIDDAAAAAPAREPSTAHFAPRVEAATRSHPRRISNRALTILIKEGGDNKVNLRIPLGLARVAGKFIPKQAQNYLKEYEIDLQQFLDAGELEGGTILEIKDGDNRVLIAVE
jgi:hypothetical protein